MSQTHETPRTCEDISTWCREHPLYAENGESIPVSVESLEAGVCLIGIGTREIDVTDASRVLTEICKNLRDLTCHCVIDLQQCTYLSSLGLGALARLTAALSKYGKELFTVNVSDEVRELMQITNLGQVIRVCTGIDEVLKDV